MAAVEFMPSPRPKQPPTLSQQPWPTPHGEASASGAAQPKAEAAADAVTGPPSKKKNKQLRSVEAARPESPERPLQRVEAARPESPERLLRRVEAARPESPERLQQLVDNLSDENLRLRRRICELEAQLLQLQQQPRQTQWRETML